ncbi:MAG: M20/M25/M40 family metallo-hydrolase [Maledivibacter sp.]|jgi:putative aminopeptidase FrvX|nr:M20/M25/M40 family metallo-hydrolase [Maledivibacter sp.]
MKPLEMIKDLSNCYGAPGFEDNVLEVVNNYKGDLSYKKDSMMNCYLNLDKRDSNKMTVMLDAHLDEVAFMVQSIDERGLLNILPLGGWIAHNIPAHLVMVKNAEGKYIKGIVTSKPPHFMTAAEKEKKIEITDLQIDVGATSREEVLNEFKINIAAPIVPFVEFEYNEKNQIMMGKAFDNRLGCAAVIEVLKRLENENLPTNIVGALAAQEEVGTRGAVVTSNVVKPNIAIVFEGTPADDLYTNKYTMQSGLNCGPQIRHRDSQYVSHHRLITFAKEIAKKNNIICQDAVRVAGSTNAAKIHLSNEGVPTLVLGIPTRYVHTHHCYASYKDFENTVKLAVEIIKNLDNSIIDSF